MMFLVPTGDKGILTHARVSPVSLEERVAKTEKRIKKELMDIERWMKAASCFSLIAEKISRNSTETGETVDLRNIFKGLKLVVLAEQEKLITDPR